MSYRFDAGMRDRVRRNLGAFVRKPIEETGLRQAAVAIVVAEVESGTEACILLTKRPAHLRRHANQFALPGGRCDEGETATGAALRETHEELGLRLEETEVLGLLDDYPTRSGFRITPVVVWAAASADLAPDPNEVARVYRIPFSELDSPAIPHLIDTSPGQPPVLSAPLPTTSGLVYSPTAAILYQFREVAMNGREVRVAHFDQPRFAWK